MATTEFIAAIELGSSKVTGIAGRKNSDGSMQVLAYAKEDSSSFIRKGVIYNLNKTAQSLTSIINRLEGDLKESIAKVYVGISGQSLRTVRNVVSRDLKEETLISQELVDAICDENLEIPLIESERRSGCALVDFGADTTTISVYKGNILRFMTVLPLGGNCITRDITSLRIEEEEAESLKITYADATYEEEGEEKATCQLEDEERTIELGILNDIIGARVEEIIDNVWNQIQLSGYDDKLLAGIIITGGTANLKNLDEVLRKRTKIDKVRIARNIRNTIYADGDLIKKDGTQNTLFGLLFEGKENCCLVETRPVTPPPAATEPVNMFEEDEALKEQEAAAREAKKRREEEDKRRKEEEKRRKEEEKKKKEEARRKKKEGPSWFEKTFNKISNEIFSDDDMK